MAEPATTPPAEALYQAAAAAQTSVQFLDPCWNLPDLALCTLDKKGHLLCQTCDRPSPFVNLRGRHYFCSERCITRVGETEFSQATVRDRNNLRMIQLGPMEAASIVVTASSSGAAATQTSTAIDSGAVNSVLPSISRAGTAQNRNDGSQSRYRQTHEEPNQSQIVLAELEKERAYLETSRYRWSECELV